MRFQFDGRRGELASLAAWFTMFSPSERGNRLKLSEFRIWAARHRDMTALNFVTACDENGWSDNALVYIEPEYFALVQNDREFLRMKR